jgi:hypothetical protein
MAGETIRRCAIELSIGMAGCASGILVLACQREAGRVVVKIDVLPATGHVAGFTSRSKLPVVSIL